MTTIITNGTILTPDEQIRGGAVVVEGGKIAGVERGKAAGTMGIDAHGHYVIPGLIDIHIHGADGFDTMDATPEAIRRIGRFIAKHGVTSYLPTTVTASAPHILASIENVRSTPAPADGAQHLGIHLEGPYLDRNFKGAQPTEHLRLAERAEYQRWLDSKQVRLITVAPEIEGVPELIRLGTAQGIEFALGHTAGSYEQATAAADMGARQAAHAFNGMPALHHRTPGVIGAVLSDDRIWPQIITDGVHLHPAVVKLVVRAKGTDHTILITDATRATGMPDGEYALGDQRIHVRGGVARTAEGGLAGSTLTMDAGLRNLMQFAGLDLQEALPMATRVPAKSIGFGDSKGRVAAGFDADLVILDAACQVRLTMVRGQVVFSNL